MTVVMIMFTSTRIATAISPTATLIRAPTVMCMGTITRIPDERDWPTLESCFADPFVRDMTSMVGGEPVAMTSRHLGRGKDP
jgi:hypothetical protein